MILSWNTTKRCNLYCKHCYRDSDDKRAQNELDLSQALTLVEQIKASRAFRIIILSGGEPLLRDDLEDIAAHVKSCGMVPVLGTNGTLMSKERARSLKESGVAAAAISLDSTDKEKHDRFRQTPGAFEQSLEGIANAREAGVRIQINPTITKDNVDELEAMITMAEELGAGALHPFFLVEAGRGKCIKENALSDEAYFDALKQVLSLQTKTSIELKPTCAPQFMGLAKEMNIPMRFTRGCLAGTSYCCILPDGKVHICPYLPLEAGDTRKQPFYEIWKTSELFTALRDDNRYEGNCGSCSNMSICGGCRARSYYHSGSYLGEDPMSYICFKEQDEEQ